MRPHFGPRVETDGEVTFQVFAPDCPELAIQLEDRVISLKRQPDGLFQLKTSAKPGECYWFIVPDGNRRPDPASRYQPTGVHGPSQLCDPRAYHWSDESWGGIPREDLILYELHIGCFTSEGTYQAAIRRLDELVELGVTAVELMPVAQSTGAWNWGYDGVNLFAPRNTFGTPDDLKELVDAAHHRGLAVVLDVVYNHFGAEGNYLHPFGGYISQRHTTIWGDAPNTDDANCRAMRDYLVSNAVYWIEEFHFDGLRLDATHCIMDTSPRHIVAEIGQAVGELQSRLGRHIHLISESNVYDPELLRPLQAGGHGFDALWCDDFLHAVSAMLRPGEHMSDREYEASGDLDLVLRRGYVFEGTFTRRRRRIPLTEAAQPVPLEQLITAIQNHDYVGNHPLGRRIHQLTSESAQRAAAALLLMYPALPMLFMGEEFACESPFLFFVDFQDQHLREAVEAGRRREYQQHDWSDVESCLSPAAFERSKIGQTQDGNAETWRWYRELIGLRKQWRAAGLLNSENFSARWDEALQLAQLEYRRADEAVFALVRLHAVGQGSRNVRVRVGGETLFSQGIAESNGDVTVLGEFGVLIGTGKFELIAAAI